MRKKSDPWILQAAKNQIYQLEAPQKEATKLLMFFFVPGLY